MDDQILITVRLNDEDSENVKTYFEQENCEFKDKASWVRKLIQDALKQTEKEPSEIELIRRMMEITNEQNHETFGKLRNLILAIGLNLEEDKKDKRISMIKKIYPELF